MNWVNGAGAMELLISLLLGAGLLGFAASEAEDAEDEYNAYLNSLNQDGEATGSDGGGGSMLDIGTGTATGGDDLVTLTNRADVFDAGPGDDTVHALKGFDSVRGGTGDDTLNGDGGKDLLEGNGGDDLLMGGEWDDGLFGGTQNDELHGHAGQDLLQGGSGTDMLMGGGGDDLLMGASGADTLNGEAGDDILEGGGLFNRELNTDDYEYLRNLERGVDAELPNFQLEGGDDDAVDVLNGGEDDDMLILGRSDSGTGGNGEDAFVLGDWITPENPATITDFTSGEDVIQVLVDDLTTTPAPALDFRPGSGAGHVQLLLNDDVIADVYGDFGTEFVGTVLLGAYPSLQIS